MRWPFVFLLVLASVASASGDGIPLGDPVPGHSSVLVIDLLAKVIPDVQLTSAGPVGTVPRLRHIGGEEWGGNSPALDADRVATVVAFEAAGARYLVVELTLGHSDDRNEVTDLLAVFDADLSLIDAADIGFDQRSSLVDPVTLSVGPGDDVLVARSAHHNSSQSYEATALIKLMGDQLELVDLIDTFGDRDCGWSHAQDLHLDVRALASPPWPIVATVHDSLTLTGEDCEGRAVPMRSSHEIAVTYTWSAASGRYERDSDAFLRLAEENAGRF